MAQHGDIAPRKRAARRKATLAASISIGK